MLDGGKSGLQVNPKVRSRDQSDWAHRKFSGREKVSKGYTTNPHQTHPEPMLRPKRLGRDLIDMFHEAGTSILVSEFSSSV